MEPESWSNPAAVGAAAAALGPGARRDAPLGALTTSRVGGPAAVAVTAQHLDDLEMVQRACEVSGLGVLVVGRGSNLLVADRGLEGIALFLGDAFSEIAISADAAEVRAGAGAALPVLARQSAAAGIGGLEWAVGVPGSVGGAVRMNAGGHGSDIAECLIDAEIVDLGSGPGRLQAETKPPDSLGLGYRASSLSDRHVVLSARLRGHLDDPEAASERVAEIVRWRRENQPGGQNAGSVFMNPPSDRSNDSTCDSAGALIERAGLRGYRHGSAQVSGVHANFIVSEPGGSAADVVELMGLIRRRVLDETGIDLRPEVRMVGFEPVGAGA